MLTRVIIIIMHLLSGSLAIGIINRQTKHFEKLTITCCVIGILASILQTMGIMYKIKRAYR